MELHLQLKKLGKKKVKQVQFTLDETPKTLEHLLITCVKQQVEAYEQAMPYRKGDEV